MARNATAEQAHRLPPQSVLKPELTGDKEEMNWQNYHRLSLRSERNHELVGGKGEKVPSYIIDIAMRGLILRANRMQLGACDR